MARGKKIEIFVEVTTEKEFETILERNKTKLICAEIFSWHFGPCTALDRILTLFKMDWSNGEAVLIRVIAEEIESLSRLHHQSEPFYMFIVNKRVTKTFRGVDSMKFTEVIKQQLRHFTNGHLDLPTYALDEPTPDEMAWINRSNFEKDLEASQLAERQAARQADRKRHRAELMVPFLEDLNFVLFWPHAKHAHPELYERWDLNNIIMVGREELELSKEEALDVLYAGDAPLNEASIHALTSGTALAICFRILDDDKHFTSLVRYILYEDVETPPPKKTALPISAYEFYNSHSPTKDQIWTKRREDKKNQKEDERYKRARRMSEMKRLAYQAKEDAREAKKVAKENLKMDLLKAGKVDELQKLKDEPEDESEEEVEMEEEPEIEDSDIEEDENEYFPPPGMVVPGLYAPPNDVAKANGLALLFPKLVSERVTPEPEFLPPHVLVMIHMYKRHKAILTMAPHTAYIIHMGIFKATTPFDATHVAYTLKQFESMDVSVNLDDLRLCFMVSIKKDIPLLELMDLNPSHVSRDPVAGEEECAALFKVDYGDGYPVLEDFGDGKEKESRNLT